MHSSWPLPTHPGSQDGRQGRGWSPGYLNPGAHDLFKVLLLRMGEISDLLLNNRMW